MIEDFWAMSQLSLARHYGKINFNGREYWIVNKDGIDIFVLSIMAEKEGRDKAIEPGEPCDLVLRDLIPAINISTSHYFIAVTFAFLFWRFTVLYKRKRLEYYSNQDNNVR